MSNPNSHPTNRPRSKQPDSPIEAKPTIDSSRLAELISVGIVPFPENLPQEQAAELLMAVRQLRRKRLVHLIAQAIAQDILSEPKR